LGKTVQLTMKLCWSLSWICRSFAFAFG